MGATAMRRARRKVRVRVHIVCVYVSVYVIMYVNTFTLECRGKEIVQGREDGSTGKCHCHPSWCFSYVSLFYHFHFQVIVALISWMPAQM